MHDGPRITAITLTQRNPQRATIKVDRKRVATLSLNRIAELKLVVDQRWNDQLASAVADAGLYDKALKQALNRLGRRAMSRAQLDRKLRDLGYEDAVRARVFDRLTQLKLLDDAAYAQAVIRETLARKPAGPRLLQQKLAQKGIDRTLADQLIGQTLAELDQTADAAALARKRLAHLQRLDPATRKRRLFSLLARRGFDYDTINNALASLDLTSTDD